MKVCVYCASSTLINPVYFEETQVLAKLLIAADATVVYGGGSVGLMGMLADTMLHEGGKIKGVIPRFMHDIEWAHKGVSDMVLTETMHERKALLIENSDAVIALPGGCGTLEELLEAITLKRLGLYTSPIIILNTSGYYDPLRQMLERCVNENFMSTQHSEMWAFVDKADEVIPAILASKPWNKGAISFAAIR